MMVSMEHAGHGHGHGPEKKHDSHESHGAKHSKAFETVKKHTLNLLTALGIGVGVLALAPAILPAIGITMPAYMLPYLAGASGGLYLYDKYGKSDKDSKGHKSKHEGHH